MRRRHSTPAHDNIRYRPHLGAPMLRENPLRRRLSRIALSAAAVLALCASMAANHNCPRTTQEPGPSVTISMDRTEYQTGETLNIEARNGLAASIWILDAERGGRNPWWGLQRREEDEWKELDVWKPTDDECRIIVSEQVPLEELVREIEPGATRSDRWNFVNCVQLSPVGPKVEREPLQAGVYRLFLRYGSDKSSWKSNKVYSGEFSVGGK